MGQGVVAEACIGHASRLAPMLLNEMKKQQQVIEAQQREIAALTTRLAQIEARLGSVPR